MGALFAAGIYKLLKAMAYEEANGAQDRDDGMVAKIDRDEKEPFQDISLPTLITSEPIPERRKFHDRRDDLVFTVYKTRADIVKNQSKTKIATEPMV